MVINKKCFWLTKGMVNLMQRLESNKIYEISQLINTKFSCDCGKEHFSQMKNVIIEKKALEKIGDILNTLGYSNPIIVCDKNTYAACAEKLSNILNKNGIDYDMLIFKREGELVPDETALGELLTSITDENDVILSVGSGVINDICKMVSYRMNMPYIVVATAPSMDGYTSNVSALTLKQMKITLNAAVPVAFLGDVDVLKNAPTEMINSGFGDILGKYSALADWKLSTLINGEYYCHASAQIMESAVEKCIENASGIAKKEEGAISALTEALVISGIAMSFVGNSRPASGCEHHISHFWESVFLLTNRVPALHGVKVGINTLTSAMIRQKLASENIDFDEAIEHLDSFDYDNWEQNIKLHYAQTANDVIQLGKKAGINDIKKAKVRVLFAKDNWGKICEILTETSSDLIKECLDRCHAKTNPKEVLVERELNESAIIYSKELRDRYTVLQLLWDLSLLERYAKEITQEIY